MEEYNRLVERQRKWMLYLLMFFLLALLITPYERFFMSLLLGYATGYYSLRFLQSRIKAYVHTIAEQGKARSLGTFLRIGGIGIIVLFASHFPEKIHIPWFALGIGLAYAVLFIDFTFFHILSERQSRKH